jgi:hypothetical protein
MIEPNLRGSTLATGLCRSTYEIGLDREIKHNFIDCNDHLVPFFMGFGYVAHVPKVTHPEYGLVNPMHLRLLDYAHLVTVRSPFLSQLKRCRQSKLGVLEGVG